MSRAKRLSKHIERTVTGPMWHGPALAEVLDGIEAGRARRRPIASAHSIWELVLHVTAWSEIARQRIKGEATGDPTPEQDWPPVSDADADWPRAIDRLHDTHRLLAYLISMTTAIRVHRRATAGPLRPVSRAGGDRF